MCRFKSLLIWQLLPLLLLALAAFSFAIWLVRGARSEDPLLLVGGQTGPVWAIVFSVDGSLLAATSDDSTVVVWDTATWKHFRTLRLNGESARSLAFSPDGALLAAGGGDGTITLWETKGWAERRIAGFHTDSITSLTFGKDGKTLISAGSTDDDNCSVVVSSIETGTRRFAIPRTGNVSVIALCPDGQTLIAGGHAMPLGFWDVTTGSFLRNFPSDLDSAESLAISPDGKTVAVGDMLWKVHLLDMTNVSEIATLYGHSFPVGSIAFADNGKLLASAGRGESLLVPAQVKIWDVTTQQTVKVLKGDMGVVYAIAVSPDGRSFVSACYDGSIRVWRLGER
jgi:WD40 repeat protein